MVGPPLVVQTDQKMPASVPDERTRRNTKNKWSDTATGRKEHFHQPPSQQETDRKASSVWFDLVRDQKPRKRVRLEVDCCQLAAGGDLFSGFSPCFVINTIIYAILRVAGTDGRTDEMSKSTHLQVMSQSGSGRLMLPFSFCRLTTSTWPPTRANEEERRPPCTAQHSDATQRERKNERTNEQTNCQYGGSKKEKKNNDYCYNNKPNQSKANKKKPNENISLVRRKCTTTHTHTHT